MVRGRRQAHNPTLAKILRLTYNRSCSHNRPQTAACNAVYSISRRALLITRLGEQLPRPRQVSMVEVDDRDDFGCVFSDELLWLTTTRPICCVVIFRRVCRGLCHTFSAFWLRSSVVSVLISLISDTGVIGPLQD